MSTIYLSATYRGHGKVTLEPSPHAIVDTLGLAPAGVDAHEPVTLVPGEALRACLSHGRSSLANLPALASRKTLGLNRPAHNYPSCRPVHMQETPSYCLVFDDRGEHVRGPSRGGLCSLGFDVRFFTIGTCFLAETIWERDF